MDNQCVFDVHSEGSQQSGLGKPELAVLMSVYNGKDHLWEALTSISRQSYTDFQFVIIDDASTDGASAILSDFSKLDTRIKLFRNERNLGLAASLNRGLELCDATYVARMDADDIADADRLTTQLAYMKSCPEVDVCGTWVTLFYEGSGKESILKVPLGNDEIRAAMFFQNPMNHPTVMFRKDAVLAVGGYNPALRCAQDYDLWVRMAEDPAVRFSNLEYLSLRYRVYPEEGRQLYREEQRKVTVAVSEWLFRKAGFTLQNEEVSSLHKLVRLDKPRDIDEILHVVALADRIKTWGKFNITRGTATFMACLEDSVVEFLRRYFPVQELYEVVLEQRNVISNYEKEISSLKKRIEKVGGDTSALLQKIMTCGRVLAPKIPPLPNKLKKFVNCIRNRNLHPIVDYVWRRLTPVLHWYQCAFFREIFQPVPLVEGQVLVSVVIPCFNYGAYVGEAVDSVLAQTLQDVEIIVVEGGSTDGVTRDFLRNFERPKTRVLFQETATMVGENRNLGIRYAKGRYICCLDADDVLHPTYLEKAVFLLEAYGYDVVSTRFSSFGGKEFSYGIYPLPTLRELIDGNHVTTCAVFRRADWEKTPAGFVDVGKKEQHVAEDWRFWLELGAQGARFRNIVNESLLFYRTHGNSLSSDESVCSLAEQGKYLRTELQDVLNAKAVSLSQKNACRYLVNAVPGGVLAQSTFWPAVNNKRDRPTLLFCMGLIINGGAERLTSKIAGHLVAQGWRVIVVCTVNDLTENTVPISWFTEHTQEVYQLQRFLSEDEYQDFIRYLIQSRGVDSILQAGSRLLYDMMPELKKEHPQLAITDLLFNVAPEGHIASNRKYRPYLQHIITENTEVENYLLANGETPASVTRIPSGVDVPCIDTQETDALRDSLGIPHDALVLGFSGRFSPEKDPLTFIHLAQRCQDMEYVHFVMTGSGPLTPAVEKELEAKKLPRMHYCGFVKSVSPCLAMYDILILPSLNDGRPLAIMEAMMLGTLCVATRVGGLSELIEHERSGILVPPGDIDALEQVVRALVADSASIESLGAAAKRHAQEHFDPQKMVQSYEAALLQVRTKSCTGPCSP